MIQILSEDECRTAMKTGEFDAALAAGAAAVILTQSWCPQWKAMKAYLDEAQKSAPALNIFYIEYDTAETGSFFEEFMAFKETAYDNREIPYVRYYADGKCTGESNYLALEGFLRRLGTAGA